MLDSSGNVQPPFVHTYTQMVSAQLLGVQNFPLRFGFLHFHVELQFEVWVTKLEWPFVDTTHLRRSTAVKRVGLRHHLPKKAMRELHTQPIYFASTATRQHVRERGESDSPSVAWVCLGFCFSAVLCMSFHQNLIKCEDIWRIALLSQVQFCFSKSFGYSSCLSSAFACLLRFTVRWCIPNG